jgi:uncharacterized protein YjdB
MAFPVTAMAPGATTITFSVTIGGVTKTATCDVTVYYEPPVRMARTTSAAGASAAFLNGDPITMAAGDFVMFAEPHRIMAGALASSDASVVDFAVGPSGQVIGMRANLARFADITFMGANGENITCPVTVN